MENLEKELNEIIEELKKFDLIKEVNIPKDVKIPVSYISYNSLDIKKNTLFFCKGLKFNEKYLKDAIDRGANSYISEKKYEIAGPNIPYIIVKDIREAMVKLSIFFYNTNNRKFKLIGITGTKGKTTTTYFVKNILDTFSKKENAYISTIKTYTKTTNEESHLTTPEIVDLHRLFYETDNNKLDFLTMEVASQGYKVGRVNGVTFDVGVFLNISEDHISSVEHPDIQDYLNCKLKLLENSKINVVNADTDYLNVVMSVAKKSKELYTYSLNNKADYYVKNIKKEEVGYSFDVVSDKFNYMQNYRINMQGIFNIENALCSIVIAKALKIPDEDIKEGLKNTTVEGRMTTYVKDNIVVIVDYAHNHLSFEKLYESINTDYKEYKNVIVFGCPGNKAYTRRRDLGILSAKYSNKIYITKEDPQYEEVEEISKDVASYIEPINKNYEIIVDREEAIKKAINEAVASKEKVVILITGKGGETMQKVKGGFDYYKSDIAVVEEMLGSM